MNRPPEILINSGFVTDQNGVWTEMVIPASVTTQNVPSVITTYATTLNWIPSTAAALTTLNANKLTVLSQTANNTGLLMGYTNLVSVSMPLLQTISCSSGISGGGIFRGCTRLTSVSFPSLTSISSPSGASGSVYGGVFYNCTGLTSVDMPKLVTITNGPAYNTNGVFCGCTGLTSVNMPELVTINNVEGGVFYGCIGLTTITLPKIQNITSGKANLTGAFTNCTGLTSVQLGSAGHPVSSIGGYTFNGCTQSGLIITIYTQGGASLSGEPWGATNADIEYEEA